MESNQLQGLGEDFLVEFLKKLPIDSLCRFLCISKPWNSLISSSYFINSFTLASSPTSLVSPSSYLKVNFSDFNHNVYAFCNPQASLVEHSPQNLHFPFRFQGSKALSRFCFVGVVCGVVCFSYSIDSSFDSTILWNPTIHKFVTLPSLSFPLDLHNANAAFDDPDDFDTPTRFESNAIGFGFDVSKNDFKVVRIWIPSCHVEWQCELPSPTFEVYSAQEGVWRVSAANHISIKSCEFNTCANKGSRIGCFVNGTIYWLVSMLNNQDGSTRTYSLLAFNCKTEEFTTMELPEEIYHDDQMPPGVRIKAKLLAYGGRLLVLVHMCWSWQRQIELWAMEGDGVSSTIWKKLFSIPDGLDLNSLNDERLVMYKPLLGKHIPNNWIKLSWNAERFDEMLSYHVYEESLLLMDDRKAKSYTKEEMVYI